MKRPVIFLDLDETVFTSARKLEPNLHEVVGSVDREGKPNSFSTGPQYALFNWLQAHADIVPTTGRSVDAFHRVSLPFNGWAICAHGAVILQPDGTVDPEWNSQMEDQYRRIEDELTDLQVAMSGFFKKENIDVRVRLVPAHSCDAYICVKHNQRTLSELYRCIPWLRKKISSDWMLHVNGNNISVMPPHVQKKAAVDWLYHRVFSQRLRIGVGDSLTDVPFMSSCDFALLPQQSQAFTQLKNLDGDLQWKP